ncbi:hypothetical protein SAMN04488005_3073 [Yoonia tamlensis]|uniref:Type 1 capsular polysaccharide biosynthesis protein J n=1 Tax=Yoonia tamlensis TaxID=390270 RepID=A0A1I6HX01_9RHOB|nr:DUF6356 family protein [Yoonia tamlensis]SFR58954.1 hypothetical protein SAMN04488005_3073 [Yoonia tamlensis]
MSDTSQSPVRRGLFATLFLDHPGSVNETYLGHMRFALGFGFWLGVAAMAALVHAFVPALCETTASRILKRLQARMDNRHKA